jgi:hypothetical protein
VINNYDHSEVINPLTVKFYFKTVARFSAGHRDHWLRAGLSQHLAA